MKKINKITLLTLVMITLLSVSALCNSGPTSWKQEPDNNIMVVDENSPIKVLHEKLTYDFRDGRNENFSLTGKVSADYTMENPVSEQQEVMMVFPFVSRLEDVNPESMNITFNGEDIPYTIYGGNETTTNGHPAIQGGDPDFEFETIVSYITDESYSSDVISLDEVGTLYTITANENQTEFKLYAEINRDQSKTGILSYGFNGYEGNDTSILIAGNLESEDKMYVFIIGDDEPVEFGSYDWPDRKKLGEALNTEVNISQISVSDYIQLMMKVQREQMEQDSERAQIAGKGHLFNEDMVDDVQLLNIYAKTIEKYLMFDAGYCSEHELWSALQNERVFSLAYNVIFEPNSTNSLVVTYESIGSMNTTDEKERLLKYIYLTNPAKYWDDFKGFEMEVLAHDDYQYVVESNVEFSREQEGVYKMTSETLPDNITFSLYPNKKIGRRKILGVDNSDLLDRKRVGFREVIGILVGIGIVISVIFIKRRERNYEEK